ncbi:MAG: GNAT family N-acetyltransferase [Chloroflexaceae bacterium]|nr:GNAT family N-acetyltransferase [Chloroflexaceae bacterium]
MNNILPLDHTNPLHTRIVLSLVLQSTLDYGQLDSDIRLLTWQAHQGQWAVAVREGGVVAGIVCVVPLSDGPSPGLLWLEVLPRFQRQGVGTALLSWAGARTRRTLVVRSVPSATEFYRRAGARVAA